MSKSLICIVCPRGCALEVDAEQGTVTGNTCKRGEVYGLAEVTNPVRVLTSTVKVRGRNDEMLPVRTRGAIAKRLISDAMRTIDTLDVKLPVKMGDTIFANIAKSGVDLIASRSLEK